MCRYRFGRVRGIEFLGGFGEQLSVRHGLESMDTLPCLLSYPNTVYMYPVEYLTYAQETAYIKEDLARLITRPDAVDTTGIREFRFADHVGSLRLSVDENGQARTYDYDPWGALIGSSSGDTVRRGFNDAEEDRETSTLDLGVRHYDEGLGRFLSVDPLMAKSPSVSPNVYSGDDPVNFTDPSGMQARPLNPDRLHAAIKSVKWYPVDAILGAGEGIRMADAFAALSDAYDESTARTNAIGYGPQIDVDIYGVGRRTIGGYHEDHPTANGETLTNQANKGRLRAIFEYNPLDALRHAYAAALAGREGNILEVLGIGWVHEAAGSNSPEAAAMDRYNNAVGAVIGFENPGATDNEIWKLVWAALENGELQTEPHKADQN